MLLLFVTTALPSLSYNSNKCGLPALMEYLTVSFSLVHFRSGNQIPRSYRVQTVHGRAKKLVEKRDGMERVGDSGERGC